MVVYFLGFFYGEKVLKLPLTRRLLTRQREAQIKGYFHRHGFKILVSGRFVPGFRTAAYLTAGILKLPPVKLLLTDLVAASLSTFLMFSLGYLFAYQIQKGLREVQLWLTVGVAVGFCGLAALCATTERKRARASRSAHRFWTRTTMRYRSAICRRSSTCQKWRLQWPKFPQLAGMILLPQRPRNRGRAIRASPRRERSGQDRS